MISYQRLWKKIETDGVTQYRLMKEGISSSTLMRLRKNENVNTDTLNKLCSILNCNIEDIVEYIKDTNN